uniref:Peu 4 n=1 Tax=Peucetia striata TaxID=2066576 RepID=A0A8D7ZRY4_9ARAC|nr:Peu 4 precursor [Peucetia striata]
MKISLPLLFFVALLISVSWANEMPEEDAGYLSERLEADFGDVQPEFRGIRCPKSWKCKDLSLKFLARFLRRFRQRKSQQ